MRTIIKKIIGPFLKKASAIYLSKARKYRYKNISVVVEPSVFPPFLTISTRLLLNLVETLEVRGKSFLELGCGCGIISILAAKNGALVTATDINTVAIDALKHNAACNKVAIEILYSDLFENLQGKYFDYIVINPPYYPRDPTTIAENAWYCGKDFEYFNRLFIAVYPYISNNNIFMILSQDCEIEFITSLANKNNVTLILHKSVKHFAEYNYIYRVTLLV